MIDAYDPDQEVDDNDALISWVQSLKSFETKLVELINKERWSHAFGFNG